MGLKKDTGGDTPRVTKMFRKGRTYMCVDSQSFAYIKGKRYTCYLGYSSGKPSLKGEDGLEDVGSMLLSTFKEVEERKIQ